MSDKPHGETRKRILFLSFLLGGMAGIAIYLVLKALASGNVVLMVVLLPMAISAVPLVRSLRELRRGRARGMAGEEAT